MKTQNQKHEDKFSKRIARLWSNIVDWAEDIDLGEILMNLFLILLVSGIFFGFMCIGISGFHEDKADSITDTVAVMDSVQTKSDTTDFDTIISDTRIIIKANRPVKIVVK